MTPLAHGIWVGAAAGEIALIGSAALILLRQTGMTLAEAGAYGLICSLMLLSLVLQVTLLAGCPRAALPFEALLLAAAAGYLLRHGGRLRPEAAAVVEFTRRHPLVFGGILSTLSLLVFLLVAMPALDDAGGAFSWGALAGIDRPSSLGAEPSNHRVLVDLFKRLSDGSGLLGLLGYLVIGLATYALARRYAWPPTAATVTLVVLSQPRLLYQALSSGEEILPAAVGVFCLLALYRTVEKPRFADLVLLVLGLAFAVADQALGVAFPVVLGLLSVVVLYRRHGGLIWWRMARRRSAASLAVSAAALVFSQFWRWSAAGSGAGPGRYPLNADAIVGAAANAVRYLVQSVDLLPASDHLFDWIFHVRLMETLNDLYLMGVEPLVGQQGAAAPFALVWGFDPQAAWFGPLGFALVLPAVGYALVRGPRRLKAVAIAMTGYGYLACLIPAWLPGNAALFTRFFACSGFMVAFLLPPWRLTSRDKLGLQVFCLLLLCYAALGRWWWG